MTEKRKTREKEKEKAGETRTQKMFELLSKLSREKNPNCKGNLGVREDKEGDLIVLRCRKKKRGQKGGRDMWGIA